MSRTKRSVVGGQWSVARDQSVALKGGAAARRPAPSRRGFTLTEMLVTIAIIAILASLAFGGLQIARNSARESATKATIAKLNNIIMARYESYLTRRLPLGNLIYPSDVDATRKKNQRLLPADAAQDRLYALRDLMRMEMPDRGEDVADDPIVLPNSKQSIKRPALNERYVTRLESYTSGNNGAAELLFMIVSMGSPEGMEQFNQSEIGDTDKNGFPEFIDGWGRPIFFLRWAPGFSNYSGVQVANAITNHDPFDPRHVDSSAYQLIPLIYSAGPYGGEKFPGLINGNDQSSAASNYHFGDSKSPGEMFTNGIFPEIGKPVTGVAFGGITNHSIEQR